jgi:hypothetical protein
MGGAIGICAGLIGERCIVVRCIGERCIGVTCIGERWIGAICIGHAGVGSSSVTAAMPELAEPNCACTAGRHNIDVARTPIMQINRRCH